MNFRDAIKDKQRIVIKIGSSSLQHPETGDMDYTKLDVLVRELCDLRNQGKDVILVSSGAIAVGKKVMNIAPTDKEIPVKQACAAVGQAKLMMVYEKLFAEICDIGGYLVSGSLRIGGNAALCHYFVVFVYDTRGDVGTAQVDAYIIHKYHVPFCIAYIYKVIILSLPLFVKRDLDGACCEKRSVNCSLSRSGHWSLLSHSDKL